MIFLLVISLIFIVLGGYVSWSFGIIGMLAATLLLSFWGVFVEHSLRGFGSPTASLPPEFSWSHSLTPFLICLMTTITFYSAITMARYYLKTENPSQIFIGLWLAIVVGGGVFYFVKEASRKSNTFSYLIIVGFDDELPLDFTTAVVKVKTSSGSHMVSFNSGGGSAEPGPYGFKSDISGELELQERPTEIEATFLDGKTEHIKAMDSPNILVFYFNKKRELKVYQK